MKIIKISAMLIALLALPLTSFAAGDKISTEIVEGATTVDVVEVKNLFDNGAIFIDVRSDKDWDAGRIPDAEHLNLKTVFNEENLAKVIVNKSDPVVIYCNGQKCLRSSKASKMAVDWGYTNVYYFREGFPAWKSANYPVE